MVVWPVWVPHVLLFWGQGRGEPHQLTSFIITKGTTLSFLIEVGVEKAFRLYSDQWGRLEAQGSLPFPEWVTYKCQSPQVDLNFLSPLTFSEIPFPLDRAGLEGARPSVRPWDLLTRSDAGRYDIDGAGDRSPPNPSAAPGS